jgi:hypothetical protein
MLKKKSKQPKKPTPKQQAIIALLERMGQEGKEYFFLDYGPEPYLKAVNDKKLDGLVKTYLKALEQLDDHLEKLSEQVEDFDLSEIEW